jgi:hypothetical protein
MLDLSADMRALLDDPDGAFTLFAPLDRSWTVTAPWGATVDLAALVTG